MPVLFGGHVIGGTNAGAGEVLFFVEYFRDSEIS